MASVRHENVVQVFATGRHGATTFFVMEYVPGITVAAVIDQARNQGRATSLSTINAVLAQVSHGLSAIHETGLYHGDVKPSNMLVSTDFRVAVTDFGLAGAATTRPTSSARLSDRHDPAPRDVSGTPIYLAPELLNASGVSPTERNRCDIYALGISAFELLTGRPPFEGKTVQSILEGHRVGVPPRVSERRPGLPVQLDDVIARVLAKDPTSRFQDPVQFASAFGRASSSSRHACKPLGGCRPRDDERPQRETGASH